MRNIRFFLEDMHEALNKMIEIIKGLQIDDFFDNRATNYNSAF